MSNERTALTSPSPLSVLTETRIRHGFIQKVYGILTVQLAAAAGTAYFVMQWAKAMNNPPMLTILLFSSLALTLGVMCFFMRSPNSMRSAPLNYILLSVFTVAEAVLIGFISAQFVTESVLIVLGITVIVFFSLTLFACQTSIDFTGMAVYLFVAVMVLFGFRLVSTLASMFGAAGSPAFEGMRLFNAACGALIFSCYLVYDTQLMIGGKHQHHFGIDDYVLGAMSLYIDIMQLFLSLLRLFGRRR